MSGPESDFRVSLSHDARKQLRDLIQRADQLQLYGSVRQSLERAAIALAQDPQSFGDPLYRIRHGNGNVRQGISAPFVFRFALYPDQRVVFVFAVLPVPSSSLDVS